MGRSDRGSVLTAALTETGVCDFPVTAADLTPLPAAGVAHDHWAIAGTGLLVRVPRLSQSGRAADDNLRYQAACFSRAQPGGVTPRLYGVLPVGATLPMGALVVDRIDGRPVHLPDDLPAVATCLAALHRLPVPDISAPLPRNDDPVTALLGTIQDQAGWLDEAGLAAESIALVRAEITAAQSGMAHAGAGGQGTPAAIRLIMTDAHPGNFLVDAAGKAWFVDLEKAAYSHPAIDIAHATLPTSVGWDERVTGAVSPRDVADFEAAYLATLPPDLSTAVAPWLAPIRRLVWLRSVTWFARWRARSDRAGDPWNAADLPSGLRRHMRHHVDASLSPEGLGRVRQGLGGP